MAMMSGVMGLGDAAAAYEEEQQQSVAGDMSAPFLDDDPFGVGTSGEGSGAGDNAFGVERYTTNASGSDVYVPFLANDPFAVGSSGQGSGSGYEGMYGTSYMPHADGSAMGWSTPVSVNNGGDWDWEDAAVGGGIMGALGSVLDPLSFGVSGAVIGGTLGDEWLTGEVAFDNLTAMTAPVYNTYEPGTYDPNAPNYFLTNTGQQDARDLASMYIDRSAPSFQDGSMRQYLGQDIQRIDPDSMLHAREMFAMRGGGLGPATTYGGATIEPGQQNQDRGRQLRLRNALLERSQGRGSAAQAQLERGRQAAVQQARAIAASNPSVSPAVAMRQAREAEARINDNAAAQSEILRAEEMAQAEQSLGQVLAQARGQDMGYATQQARLRHDAGLAGTQALNDFEIQRARLRQDQDIANARTRQQQQQMTDQLVQTLERQGYSRDQAQLLASIEFDRMRSEAATQAIDLESQVAEANADRASASQGGELGMVGGLLMGLFSDERLKSEVEPLEGSEIDDFIRSSPTGYGKMLASLRSTLGR